MCDRLQLSAACHVNLIAKINLGPCLISLDLGISKVHDFNRILLVSSHPKMESGL